MDWSNVLSVLVGCLVTVLVSRRYYIKASEDLKQETDNLKQLTKQLMRMMDDAGLIEVEWDADGNPLRIVRASALIRGSSSVAAKAEVVPANEPRDKGENERRS